MTLEKASELVSALRLSCPPPSTKAEDLFDHFVDLLKLESQKQLETFARMCGYGVLGDVEVL